MWGSKSSTRASRWSDNSRSRLAQQGANSSVPALPACSSHYEGSWPTNSSTSALTAVSLPSVVRRSPSAVRSVMRARASKAVACALGLQKTSRYSSSRAAASPAAREGGGGYGKGVGFGSVQLSRPHQ